MVGFCVVVSKEAPTISKFQIISAGGCSVCLILAVRLTDLNLVMQIMPTLVKAW